MRIRCVTLFDITKTDVNSRRVTNIGEDPLLYNRRRNQQINFETILQIINMRSQPEDITTPIRTTVTFKKSDYWGTEYKSKEPVACWAFMFNISHSSVFNDGQSELGNLFKDCDGVPMITRLEEWDKLISKLNISKEYKNIHFELVNE